jgi:RNA polymerase sigma factor (sigma-70 family)
MSQESLSLNADNSWGEGLAGLLAQLLDEDNARAIDELLLRSRPVAVQVVHVLARLRCLPRDQVEDAVQDAMGALYRALRDRRYPAPGDPATPASWQAFCLHLIRCRTVNASIRESRWRRWHVGCTRGALRLSEAINGDRLVPRGRRAQADGEDPARLAEWSEENAWLEAALTQLGPEERQTWDAWWGGMKLREVAARNGTSVRKEHARRERVLAKLVKKWRAKNSPRPSPRAPKG